MNTKPSPTITKPASGIVPLFFQLMSLLSLAACSYLPLDAGLDLPGVRITDRRDHILLEPATGPAQELGLMFWPGGLVDPQAYRASLGPLAARGFRVVIVKVPANLAIMAIEKGLEVATRLGGSWVAAGHSLGGTAASWTVHDHPRAFQGLVLMASYPVDDRSLADWDGPVLSITAERDGLVGPAEMATKVVLLPPESPTVAAGATVYSNIAGGNHAQFGHYGEQEGDNRALISAAEQHLLMANEVEAFLQAIQGGL